jgi:hypothetical protein
MILTNDAGLLSTILGRAYHDEPVKLMAVADWGNAIEVRREGDQSTIGFRKEWIYRFDSTLFAQLSPLSREIIETN